MTISHLARAAFHLCHLICVQSSECPAPLEAQTIRRLRHNHRCIEWVYPAEVRDNGVELWPGSFLCRAYTGALEGIGRTEGSACLGNEHYLVARTQAPCLVFWHPQAFNALPLPQMTVYFNGSGVCRSHATGAVGKITDSLGTCEIEGSDDIQGGYGLLGAYNVSAPYLPMIEDEADSLARYRKLILDNISTLVLSHIDQKAEEMMHRITGHPVSELLDGLKTAPIAVLDRFLSSDRWVHTELNMLGMHLLRCTLAEKITDGRRRQLGAHLHPDYADFHKDGFLVKDFSKMDNSDLSQILQMVSGYKMEDIPLAVWTMRAVESSATDINLDLHVDTFAPTWKIWLYGEDIAMEVCCIHRFRENALVFSIVHANICCGSTD
eukprot:SAG11_NODE_2741_length_3021_cov_3.097536_1_plen_380_part_00